MSPLLRDNGQSALPARGAHGQPRPGAQLRSVRLTRPAGHSRSAPISLAPHEGFRVAIHSTEDILEARKKGRELATALEFPSIDRTLIASVISELGHNIVHHAQRGEISVRSDETLGGTGIIITATDNGPGIRDVRGTLQEGMGPARALGLGLPGVRRIVDEFDIVSRPRQGTTVTVKKWKPQ